MEDMAPVDFGLGESSPEIGLLPIFASIKGMVLVTYPEPGSKIFTFRWISHVDVLVKIATLGRQDMSQIQSIFRRTGVVKNRERKSSFAGCRASTAKDEGNEYVHYFVRKR